MWQNSVFGCNRVLKRWQCYVSVVVSTASAVRRFCGGMPNLPRIWSSRLLSNRTLGARSVSELRLLSTQSQPSFERIAICWYDPYPQNDAPSETTLMIQNKPINLFLRPHISGWVHHFSLHKYLYLGHIWTYRLHWWLVVSVIAWGIRVVPWFANRSCSLSGQSAVSLIMGQPLYNLKPVKLNYSSPNEHLSTIFYRCSFRNNTNISANLQVNQSHTFREHALQNTAFLLYIIIIHIFSTFKTYFSSVKVVPYS